MRKNQSVWVLCPDKTGKPVLKRRRLATEVGEFGCSRMTFESRAVAEEYLQTPHIQWLTQKWRVVCAVEKMDEQDLAILSDVAYALRAGRSITVHA